MGIREIPMCCPTGTHRKTPDAAIGEAAINMITVSKVTVSWFVSQYIPLQNLIINNNNNKIIIIIIMQKITLIDPNHEKNMVF